MGVPINPGIFNVSNFKNIYVICHESWVLDRNTHIKNEYPEDNPHKQPIY